MGRGTSSYPYMPTAETESSQAKAHKASRIGIAHSSTCHDSRVTVAESFFLSSLLQGSIKIMLGSPTIFVSHSYNFFLLKHAPRNTTTLKSMGARPSCRLQRDLTVRSLCIVPLPALKPPWC
jgi:hypothetical protein